MQSKLEHITEFEYLGRLLTWDAVCCREIKRRITKTSEAMIGFNKTWKSKVVIVEIKLEMPHAKACIFSGRLQNFLIKC